MFVKKKVKLVGKGPLLLHSDAGVDPLHPMTQKLGELVKQKKAVKTAEAKLEIDAEISRLEWELGMHRNAAGPVLPASYFSSGLRDAARATREGKKVERGLRIGGGDVQLQYDGPKDLAGMWEARDESGRRRFADRRSVAVSGKRVIRTRPRFEGWTGTMEVIYDDEMLSEDDVKRFFDTLGFSGIGDHRPTFGHFDTVW